MPNSTATNNFPTVGEIHRNDERINAIVPADAKIEELTQGFAWSEGPIWDKKNNCLYFVDIPNNVMHDWSDEKGLGVHIRPAGYAGGDEEMGRELGANGTVIGPTGKVTMCDHGNRCISELQDNFAKKYLVREFEGKRFNSPNDLIFHTNGDLFFTDPPYGLEGCQDSPLRELDFCGVFRLTKSGELSVVVSDLTYPNGLAFSPDEKTFYVTVSDPDFPRIMAYDFKDDGTVENARVFYDGTADSKAGKKGLPDGMTLDIEGNIYSTGPGGVLVFTPEGEHLGTIDTREAIANCTFGNDGSTLYMTSHMKLCRVDLNTTGLRF